MPIKRIQFPDGSIKRVEVPEGATDEQILSLVQSQHQPQETKQQWDDKPDFSNVTGKVGPTVPAKGKKPAAFYNRTYDPVLRLLGGTVDGLQHHLGNIPTAIAQAGANHGEWLGNKLFGKRAPTMAEMVSGRRETFADRVNQHVKQREADYQARTGEDALSNAGSYGGAVAGEVLPWMMGMGAMRTGGLLPTITATGVKGAAQKGALLAAEGGAMGAAQPVTQGNFGTEKAQQVGVGALAAPLTAGAIKLGGGVAKYATPSGRDAIANERLARMFGTSPETLAALQADSGIPGFQHTIAQRLATPEAVQAERILRNQGNTAAGFASREGANNAALRAEAQRLAGTDAEMLAAQDARSAGPGAFWQNNMARGAEDGRYGRAQQHLAAVLAKGGRMSSAERDMLDQARKIAGQVQRGTMDMAEGDALIRSMQPGTKIGQKALAQALGVIDGGMVNPARVMKQLESLAKDTNPTVSGAAEKALASIAKNQDGMGWVHGRVLDGLRQNIGKLLADSAPISGAGSAEGAAFGPVKAKIVNTLDRAIPGYRDNLAAYARASQPINDMEAGRTLLGAIDGGGRDATGGQAVTLNHLKSLLAKDAKSRYPMSNEARARAEAMLDALQRRSITNNTIAATGPGTAADALRGVSGSPLGQRMGGGILALLGGAFGGADAGLAALLANEGGIALNNNIMRRVGEKAADSRLSAQAIEAYRRSQNPALSRSPLVQLLPYDPTP